MGLKTWINGAKGIVVKGVIDQNFKLLGRYLSMQMLTLKTSERLTLGSDYLSEGLLVFDSDEEMWYCYLNGKWQKKSFDTTYTKEFSDTDWANGRIVIDFKTHLVSNPSVQIYMNSEDGDTPVVGGFIIDDVNNIIIESDMSFSGRVVIR
jgi:hypothetical protein